MPGMVLGTGDTWIHGDTWINKINQDLVIHARHQYNFPTRSSKCNMSELSWVGTAEDNAQVEMRRQCFCPTLTQLLSLLCKQEITYSPL